jgi:VCBS repeat-containing protein
MSRTNGGERPLARNDLFAVGEDETTSLLVLANDRGPANGGNLKIVDVSAPGLSGAVQIAADGRSLVWNDLSSAFDWLADGATIMREFAYTIQAANGVESSAVVTLTITGANDRPDAGADQQVAVDENVADDVVIATVQGSDVDLGTVLAYSIVGGDAGGLFEIDADGRVSIAAGKSLDYETATQHVLTVQVSDGSLTDTAQVTIDVVDVNEGPDAGEDQFVAVDENLAGPRLLATIAGTDAEGDPLSYSIVGGNDAGLFSVDNSGRVSLASGKSLNYEAVPQHVLEVEVSDGVFADTALVTVNVNDVNDAPDAGPNRQAAVDENVAGPVVLATVAGTDADGDSLSYSIVGGNGASLFAVDGSGQVRLASGKSLNYEAVPQHVLTVRVSDGSLTDTTTVTVNVNDVNERPDAGPDRIVYVDENIAGLIATVAGTDPDGDPLIRSFNLAEGRFPSFVIDAAGNISAPSGLNYESRNEYVGTVTVSDGALSDTMQLTIRVNDIYEPPSAGPDVTVTVPEKINGEWIIVDMSRNATSPEGRPLTYSLEGDNPEGLFEIDAFGRITLSPNRSLDHATQSEYLLTVAVNDGQVRNGVIVNDRADIIVKVADSSVPPVLDAIVAGAFPGLEMTLNMTRLDGAGDGTFAYGDFPPFTPAISSVALGDVDGDGRLDVVLAHQAAGKLGILLGDASGGLLSETTLDLAGGPRRVALGDMNGDGRLDIVATTASAVAVLLNDGNGAFALPNTVSFTNVSPESVALGDYNNDGLLDVFVAFPTTAVDPITNSASTARAVLLMRGDGEGGFLDPVSQVTVGWMPADLAVADLNNDGYDDFVTADRDPFGAGSISGFLVGGAAATLPIGGHAVAIAIGNANPQGDEFNYGPGVSHLDLVVAIGVGINQFQIKLLYGDSTGAFTPHLLPVAYVTGDVSDLALADVNRDGKTDIVYMNSVQQTLNVLLGNGYNQFVAAGTYATPSYPSSFALGEFNNPDALTAVGLPDLGSMVPIAADPLWGV